VTKLKPESILDVGVGFGKWGFLFREYLDIMEGRIEPQEWTTEIIGIEIHEPYIKEWQKVLYSEIIIGNAVDVFRSHPLPMFDLVFCSDVLEHIPKDNALLLLEQFRIKGSAVLVNVPIGEEWLDQGALYGNPHEAHVSAWHPSDDPLKSAQYRKFFELPNKRHVMSVGWGFY
jgi:2-polyprenyl-3-methyl-5-hydroxy-6-metoxy-1,4-benzoquinol methylase